MRSRGQWAVNESGKAYYESFDSLYNDLDKEQEARESMSINQDRP